MSKQSVWGKIAAVIATIAAIVAIFTFLTGKQNVPELIGINQQHTPSVTPVQLFPAPTVPAGKTPSTSQGVISKSPFTFFDDFSVEQGYWDTGGSILADNRMGTIDLSIVDGNYRWVAVPTAPDPNVALWHREMPKNVPALANFDLEAEFIQTGEARETQYGFDFRQNEKGYYTFHIDNLGRYVFALYDESTQKWDEIIKWTNTPHLDLTGPNTLRVVAKGSRIQLFINNQLVGNVNENRLSDGNAGISITVWGKDKTSILETTKFSISEN